MIRYLVNVNFVYSYTLILFLIPPHPFRTFQDPIYYEFFQGDPQVISSVHLGFKACFQSYFVQLSFCLLIYAMK